MQYIVTRKTHPTCAEPFEMTGTFVTVISANSAEEAKWRMTHCGSTVISVEEATPARLKEIKKTMKKVNFDPRSCVINSLRTTTSCLSHKTNE